MKTMLYLAPLMALALTACGRGDAPATETAKPKEELKYVTLKPQAITKDDLAPKKKASDKTKSDESDSNK